MNTDDPDSAKIWKALSAILDPEYVINIVDLGLIYGVDFVDGQVTVVMTLTTPTCPAGAWIHEGVKLALAGLPCVKKSEVRLVFDPPWSSEMLSDNARRELGCSSSEF